MRIALTIPPITSISSDYSILKFTYWINLG